MECEVYGASDIVKTKGRLTVDQRKIHLGQISLHFLAIVAIQVSDDVARHKERVLNHAGEHQQ